VEVRNLPTPFGSIHYTARPGKEGVEVRIEGDLRVPPGGIDLRLPGIAGATRATINGKDAAPEEDGGIIVREVPASVHFSR